MWRPAFLVAAFCLLGVAIEANPICVNKAADVMFVLDSSSSIWIVDYQEKLKFVADLVKSFGAGRGDSQIRIGAIIFSDQSHLEFSFDTYNKPSQLKRAILDIPHIGGGTNTADALRLLEEEVEPYLRYSKGPTIAVVITDGQSQDHAATKEEARKLHKLGVIVYAIGVGEQFDINELEAIASNPHYVFTVSSYSALKEIKDAIYVRVCEETVRSKLTTSPRTTTTAYEGSRLEITVAPNDRQPAAGLPETVKHECINKAADVMFVLDSSTSIWIEDYKQKLKFVADLVKSFGVGGANSQIRIGAITFSDKSQLEFSFDTYTNPSQLKRAILDIPHIGGGTNTADALRLLEEQVEPYLRYSKGPTIAVVITDGQSQDHAATKEEARKLHELGVIVYAIGVGDKYDINELKAIASNQHYVFTVSSYSALKEIKDAIYVRVCEEESGTSNHRPTVVPTTTTQAPTEIVTAGSITPDSSKCINKAADVMFVLDSSTSIWIVDYKQKLKFVADLVKSFGVGGANSQIRIGAITFSDQSHLEFSFDTYNKPFQLKRAILNIPHIGGGTNTADALRLLEEEVEPYLRYSKGPTIAVVITDGQSQDHAATKEEARKLHELGVIVYAIGVGDKYDINELKAIASNPHYVFTVSSYSALKEIKDAIYVRVCEEESGTSNHRPTAVPTITTPAPTEIVTAGSITPDSTKCINKAADVMFVLDSSTSIWIEDYKQKLKFVADLVKNFGVGGANSQIRIGAITFSDQSHLEFSFDTYTKPFQLKRAILNIPHIGGGTNTADALRLLEEKVEPYLRYSKGPTIAVVITDGQSQDHAATKEEARKLHELGVIVYAIGVGDKYDINELKAIASNPHYVYTVSSYSALKEIKDAIYVRVCEEKSGTSNHRPAVVPTTTTPAPTEIVTPGSITPDSSKCINKAADVMFVLDSSTSIWIEDYKQKLKFVADLVKNFGVGGANSQIRIGAITFSDQSHLEFSFDTYTKPFQLKRAILNIPHIGGGTNTADALRLLEEEVEPYLRYSKGPTIAVVITDGQSQDHAATKEEARKLHGLGVIVYAIGVGDKYDINELKAIASNPHYVFTVSSYSALKEIKDAIYVRVCEEESGTSNHRKTVVPTTTAQAPTEIVTAGSITPDSKKCINKAADVMFVLDSSTSIWIEDYKQKLKFVADLVKSFGVGRGDSQIRIGAITFSDQSHLEFSFDTYTKPFQLKRAILNIPHIGGGTNTADALRLLEEQVEPYLRYSKGPTIAVVITDGQSQDHAATKEEARKLHKLGVIVYAIGVGEQFDINELEAIASNPHYVFTVSSYSALKEIKNAIYVRVCEEESGPSNPRSTAVPTITAQAPTGIVIAGSITPDPSSIILFGYDLVAMGAYRSAMIHQFINTLLPYTGYGHFGVVTYGYCPSRFNVPITPLKDNDASTIVNSIPVDIALPNLVDVVREMRKMFHSHSMQNDQSGHFENQVAVLFIDPSITTITSELTKVIEMLKRRGVKLYLVNVGTCPSSQLDQLYSLSSQPYRKYMFNAPSYHQLLLKAQYDPLHFKSIYNEYTPLISESKPLISY